MNAIPLAALVSTMQKQRGTTLVVGLVMLVVLTLLVISAIRSGNINMRIAGNMQAQEETTAASDQAIEQVLSSSSSTTSTASQVVAVDINNDGATDYSASVTTSCLGSVAITNAQLDPANANDAPCISSGTAQNTGLMVSGVAATGTAQSWCFSQTWEVQAQTTDARTGTTATTVQGVSMRVPAGTTCTVRID